MFLAKVVGNAVSSDKDAAYADRKLLMVQKLDLYNNPSGLSTIAVDYVGAGEGDIVLVGAAPGLASTVFESPRAPMRELVMGIVDRLDALPIPPQAAQAAP